MNVRKIVSILSAASLGLLTGSVGHGVESQPEAQPVESPAPLIERSLAAVPTELVVVEAGAAIDEQLVTHAFVVVRRADGSVPRAYLWDEPLACPDSRSE